MRVSTASSASHKRQLQSLHAAHLYSLRGRGREGEQPGDLVYILSNGDPQPRTTILGGAPSQTTGAVLGLLGVAVVLVRSLSSGNRNRNSSRGKRKRSHHQRAGIPRSTSTQARSVNTRYSSSTRRSSTQRACRAAVLVLLLQQPVTTPDTAPAATATQPQTGVDRLT